LKYRIQALWNQYRTEVMPADAGAIQVAECRRAFYAGVESALNRLAAEMSAGDSLDDPNDERALGEVNRELSDFARDVKEGRA
jgi:hypothetical protein